MKTEAIVNYIQGLEKNLGFKVTADTDIVKMTEKALEDYLGYLEDCYKQDTGQYLN